MKIHGTLLFMLIFTITSFSSTAYQNPKDYFADSLEVKLILLDESDRVSVLNQLSEHYLRNYPQKALEKANEAYQLSRKLNVSTQEARALRNIGRSFQNLTANYDSALYYCFESLKISEAKNHRREAIETHIAIANIYQEVGNYSKSIDFFTQSQVLATELKDYGKIVEVKILRAKSLINLELNSEALEELKSALKICKLHDLRNAEGKVRLALGDFYITYASPDLASENIRQALDIFEDQNDRDQYALAKFYLAQWHLSFEKTEDAIRYFRESLRIRESMGDLYGITECYFFIGLSYNKLSEYKKAIEVLSTCRNLAEKINAKRILRRCYNQFFLAYSSMEDLRKAIEYRDLYAAITELIFAEENERLIAEQQARFDIEKRDQEIEIQRERLEQESLQLKREKRFNLVLTLLVIILLGSAIFISILLRKNQLSNQKIKEINRRVLNQNQQLKNLNDTKNKFFSIISHDLKGPLASLSSFLNLLKNHLQHMTPQEITTVATDLDQSTKNLQSLLENLLTWARAQTNSIEIHPENLDMVELVEENFSLLRNQTSDKDIELVLIHDGSGKCRADRNTIGTVIRNLISNAIKFTHAHGKIEVKVEEWKDAVEVSVKDNGMGINPEAMKKIFDISAKYTTPGTKKEKGTGLGLILCKEFVEKNGGQLTVRSEVGVGSTFSFMLPKK